MRCGTTPLDEGNPIGHEPCRACTTSLCRSSRHSGNRRSEQGMSPRTCASHTLSSHIAQSSHALAHGASSRSTHIACVLECPPLPEWPPHHISDIRVTCEPLLE